MFSRSCSASSAAQAEKSAEPSAARTGLAKIPPTKPKVAKPKVAKPKAAKPKVTKPGAGKTAKSMKKTLKEGRSIMGHPMGSHSLRASYLSVVSWQQCTRSSHEDKITTAFKTA